MSPMQAIKQLASYLNIEESDLALLCEKVVAKVQEIKLGLTQESVE